MSPELIKYKQLVLTQDREVGGLANNSIYHVLTGHPEIEKWAITKEEKARIGLIEVGHDFSATLGPWVVYHHLPSQSTVKVCSGFRKPYVEIFGEGRLKAQKDLTALVALKGFQLREPLKEELDITGCT